MRASVGDHIVVHARHVGEHDREGEILEIHGAKGEPPYLARWSDDGHVALVFPGPDATIEHLAGARAKASRKRAVSE